MAVTGRRPLRTLAEIITSAFVADPAGVPVVALHENLQTATKTKRGTKVTLGIPSHVFSVDDALWFSGWGSVEMGEPDRRKPQYVPLIVFVPMAIYERPADEEPT